MENNDEASQGCVGMEKSWRSERKGCSRDVDRERERKREGRDRKSGVIGEDCYR